MSYGLEEYMQTKRYPKIEQDTHTELNNALENLSSENILSRKRGAKRLSWNSRKELGWNCYPVRLWFLNQHNKERLYRCIKSETDIKLQRDLLHTLLFFYERYMSHRFWDDIGPATERKAYQSELLSFLEGFIENQSSDIRAETAYILAMLEDNRAWDILNEVVQKKAGEIGWTVHICETYAGKSMSRLQSEKMIETLRAISKKTKNQSVKKKAERGMQFCEELFAAQK